MIVLGIAGIVRYRRHLCPVEGCRCHTKKTYRLFALERTYGTRGLKLFLSYKFRICPHDHVTSSIKSVTLSADQFMSKPTHESDWATGAVLCKKAGIPTPFVETPKLFTRPEQESYRLPSAQHADLVHS
jgi:hypothetical protein